jgi:hypothetical protein
VFSMPPQPSRKLRKRSCPTARAQIYSQTVSFRIPRLRPVATRRCAIFAIVLALGMGMEAGAAHAQAHPDTGILCPS